jgi:peptidoglycan-N-acetylglucosamine deacetylase
MTKPLASLSLDLDNEWSYLKTHGDPEWRELPSYLDTVVPRVLGFLQQRENQRITFFVVGQDAALAKNEEAIASIADAGHEIGNHSFHHEPWLHLYSPQQIVDELQTAEWHIERVTGQRPVGFRGPGYSMSDTLLETLAKLDYQYDASSLPTFIGPLARAYYFMTAKLDSRQMQERQILFGTVRDALRPLDPYRWDMGSSGLVEIPVTTMPLFRAPIHFSYIIYLSRFSRALALGYYRSALKLCQLTGTQPSLLLHPLDFLGREDLSTLNFFPGMDLARQSKLDLMGTLIDDLRATFDVVPMIEHARAASASNLPVKDLACASGTAA